MSVVRLESTDGNANTLTLINCLKNPKVQEAYFIRERRADDPTKTHVLVALLVQIQYVDDLIVLVETHLDELKGHLTSGTMIYPENSRWYCSEIVLPFYEYQFAADVLEVLGYGQERLIEVSGSPEKIYRILGT